MSLFFWSSSILFLGKWKYWRKNSCLIYGVCVCVYI
jgi:hypothetical protein